MTTLLLKTYEFFLEPKAGPRQHYRIIWRAYFARVAKIARQVHI
jgi:hypothetical protein